MMVRRLAEAAGAVDGLVSECRENYYRGRGVSMIHFVRFGLVTERDA